MEIDKNNQKDSKNNSVQKNNLSTSYIIKKRNKAVTLTICLMAICFTLCWTPFFSFALFYTKILDNTLYINLKVTIHLIGYSSSVWSPLIYILRCEKFKNSAKPLFSSIKLHINAFLNKLLAFFKCKYFRKRQFCSQQKIKINYFKPVRSVRVQPMEH